MLKIPFNIISYKFAGNANILKSCYSFWKVFTFRKVVTFQKVVIFLTDTFFFEKLLFFPKDTTFWIKWVWTDFTEQTCSLLKMAIKGSQFLIFQTLKMFLSLHLFFSQIKSKCRSTESVWLVVVLKFVEVKEVWGTAISLTGLIRFILGEINP